MPYLRDIATIRLGYPFRRALEPIANGQYCVLQIKDVLHQQSNGMRDLVRVDLPDVREEHFIRSGDVLFIARGVNKQAVAVEEEVANAIAGAQFFLVRPRAGVLPQYLAWYINQSPAQRYIEENSVGSNVRLISREVFYDLPVAVPPLETQRRIAEVNRLSRREGQLLEAIKERRRKLVEAALLQNIQGEI